MRTHIFVRIKRTTWISLCMTIAGGVWLAVPASADIVSGRVLGVDEKPIVNGTFTARNSKGESTPFKTDKSGNFSVYLDPGKYTVSPSTDASLTGVIESFPQPRQQDVHLSKGK